MTFHRDILKIDGAQEVARISGFIQQQTLTMKREGAVVGLSGGVDSALSSELAVKALGKERVFGLVLPERESNPVSKQFALRQVEKLGIRAEVIDITAALEAIGTYRRRDEVIKKFFPEYDASFRIKMTLPPDLLARDSLNVFSLTIDDGRGGKKSARLSKEALQGIVAATDTKQRTRMLFLYYYAEKMNYLVCGTTNRSEVVQGYFVKYGDGGVDIEPLAHLYKTQVFQLARELGVDPRIIERLPSPDTFSLETSDEEFYFRMPYNILDLLLYAWENQIPKEEVCRALSLSEDQVKRAFRDLQAKHNATRHLRQLPPSLL
ncbi:MAG: NAD(+) synthase [Acidobacteriota bacterium]